MSIEGTEEWYQKALDDLESGQIEISDFETGVLPSITETKIHFGPVDNPYYANSRTGDYEKAMWLPKTWEKSQKKKMDIICVWEKETATGLLNTKHMSKIDQSSIILENGHVTFLYGLEEPHTEIRLSFKNNGSAARMLNALRPHGAHVEWYSAWNFDQQRDAALTTLLPPRFEATKFFNSYMIPALPADGLFFRLKFVSPHRPPLNYTLYLVDYTQLSTQTMEESVRIEEGARETFKSYYEQPDAVQDAPQDAEMPRIEDLINEQTDALWYSKSGIAETPPSMNPQPGYREYWMNRFGLSDAEKASLSYK